MHIIKKRVANIIVCEVHKQMHKPNLHKVYSAVYCTRILLPEIKL